MRTPPDAKVQAIIYLRIVFASMPFMYFFQFLQMAQRGAGDSRTPFYFMALAVVLDMILNPLLIGGFFGFPKLGIAGSATSTLIGQGVALILLLITLYRRHSVLMLKGKELRFLLPSLEILNPLVLRGIPMSLQMFIMSAAGITMIGFVNGYGSLTSAAYVGAVQVWNYIQMPGMAIGASVSSMAGQNVGAGRWDRVNRIALVGLISSVCITGSIATAIYLMGPIPLYPFLPVNPPALIASAMHIDHTVLWAFVIFNATFALSGIVRATGAVWPPLLILLVSMVAVRVPFAYFMIPHFGRDAIWWSFPLGTLTSSALTALYFRYGNWRQVRMLRDAAPTTESGDVPQTSPAPEAEEVAETIAGEILAH
jgi:putative MATE family efflux protein